ASLDSDEGGDDDDKDYEDDEDEDEEDEVDEVPGQYPPQLLEMLFKLCMTLSLQETRDGQPQSTMLVYFSGILGMSHDGQYFLPARNSTSALSALIYIQRLLFLEHVLPYRAYPFLGRPSRPRTDQLTPLQAVRMQFMLPGSPTPLGELQRLRAFGKQQATLDPPAFFLHWSEDGNTVSLGNCRIRITAFRALPEYFIREGGMLVDTLLLGLQPAIRLETIHDSLTNPRPGYSFVSEPANGLRHCYFQLAQAAAGSAYPQLIHNGSWNIEAVHQYLQRHEQLLEYIAGILITTGGQMPRLKELVGIEYRNSPSTERALYVYHAEVVYLIRHSKSKQYTGREFNVARFLPASAGRILFLYLVYIRPFVELLGREHGSHGHAGSGNQLLFWSAALGRAWSTDRFHRLLTAATQKVWGQSVNPRQYRQLSIGITEKHVRGAHLPVDPTSDTGIGADPDAIEGQSPRVRLFLWLFLWLLLWLLLQQYILILVEAIIPATDH
ncbi:hypothetical protein BDW68DRAFT_183589, partial [Aspergillus falconensis]